MNLEQMFGLAGKNALVVGNGKVAHAIAHLFGNAGAAVTHSVQTDMSEVGVQELFADQGQIDVLVNGAVAIGAWPIEQMSMAHWDHMHDINVRGAFLLMREAVKAMLAHGRGGRLINISTIGSMHPVLHGNYAYGSSRAGINALAKQFAMDFAAEGITANTVIVGAVPSDPFPDG